ncbi:MAG: NPCBM/NEW2 domain-containing protein [Armatimonadota bacterium]
MRYLLLLTLLLAVPAMALDLYVSPSGKDINPGTKAAPFQTLEKARDTIRAAQPKGGATVWLWGGVYRLDKTFELTKEDTGTPEAPIVYRAVRPGTARLMGGAMLPAAAFKPVTDPQLLARLDPTARAAVRQVSLKGCGVPEPGPEWETRFSGAPTAAELFFNHDRMTLARWPNNKEWTRVVDPVGGAPHKIHSIPGDKVGKFTYTDERPARWAKEPDVWLHGYWFWDWSDGRQKIESIDTERKTIALAPPYHGYGYRKNARYYAMNALCELDSPGEWYLDRATWTLLFWPPASLADHEVSLSLLADPLVKMTDVSNVTLRDMTLEVSRGEGIQIANGADNLIAGCTLRNLPRLAVRVEGGLRHGVQSCDLYNLGAGGVSLNGGDRRTLTPAGHYADNNHIHHFAQLVFAYQNAIRLAGVGNRMTHNLVHDTIHEALSYSGNDHLVEFNEVYNVCLEADDSGVIHQGRDWTWRGNIIRHNFFHDIVAGNAVSNMGVYLDDMESGVEVTGNVLYRIPRAILVGGGRDNQVTGNLIIDCPIPISIDNRAMGWASYHVGTTMKGLLDKVPYTQEPWRSRYPKLPTIWEDEPGTPKGNAFTGNLMVGCGKPSFSAEVSKYGVIADNLETSEDPGFAAPARLDFSLKPDAPIYKQLPGFKPIPFEKMGVYLDDYRKALPVKAPVLNPGPGAFVDELMVTLDIAARSGKADIRYTLDGSEPTAKSPLYKQPLKLTETVTVKAAAFPNANSAEGRSGVAMGIYKANKLGPNGGVYLSELEGKEVLAHGGLKRDQTYTGAGTYSIAGQKFERGLLLCPETPTGQGHVTYLLEGGLSKATVLKAFIGVDDPANKEGSVTFAVEVFRGGKWERVFESKVVRKGEAAQAIEMPMAGAQRLRLLTTDAGDGINSDHACWAEAKLQ